MLHDGLLSPELLEVAAGLTRGLSEEESARLYHFADYLRLRSDEEPYLLGSFIPHGKLEWRDLSPKRGELEEAGRLQLGSHTAGWTARGLRCANSREQLEFSPTGRITLLGRSSFVSLEGKPAVHPGRLERTTIGIGIAAAANGASAGHAFLTLVGIGEIALGNPYQENYFSEGTVTVNAAVDLTSRADEALRHLIQEVWRAAGVVDSPNFAEGRWTPWDEAFR